MNEEEKRKIDEAVARINFREAVFVLTLVGGMFACYIFLELFVWKY